jgi:hypothetical protein
MIESGASQLRVGARQSLQYIAFVPVLVVSDETLWVADYSSRGELQREPFQVQELTYYPGRQYPLEGAAHSSASGSIVTGTLPVFFSQMCTTRSREL